jgi:hypothetical protein
MLDNYVFDRRLVEYWKSHNLKDSDFFCRECGKFMLDLDNISNVGYNPNAKQRLKLYDGDCTYKPYAESDTNRWLVKGRTLSGKTYFRHLCWDCFFKHLGEVEDIPKRARKSSWYRDVNNGILRPPATCSSPSKYFKLLFDISDEVLEAEHKKFDTASLESFIRRHGEVDGKAKYDVYKARQAYTCSKEYMMNEKGMSEKEWNDYNSSRACTKKNFIERYGEELGNKKWDEYCKTESYVGCKLEYFVEKYGVEEGTNRYLGVNKKKYQCLENYIRKYGDVEGKKRWAEYSKRPYSLVSQNLFKAIDERIGDYAKENSMYFTKGGEKLIVAEKYHRNFHPDYALGNKLIEFNGDYWHCNPKMYKEDEIVNLHGCSHLVRHIWNSDNERYDIMRLVGYDVKVVWEDDYVHDPEKVLAECVEFLKS